MKAPSSRDLVADGDESPEESSAALAHMFTAAPAAIAFRLNFAANVFTGPLYEEVDRRWGLGRAEFVVMFCLGEIPGLLARDVCALTGRPKNSIGRAVQRLLTLGHIEEIAQEKPRKGRPLRLTAGGRSLLGEIVPLFVAREAAMLAPLDATERRLFADLLMKIVGRGRDWD